MARKKNIEVKGSQISILIQDDLDFISLTDMTGGFKEGSGLIGKWITNKNTLEYLGIWEKINNPDFNYPEFGVIEQESGVNPAAVNKMSGATGLIQFMPATAASLGTTTAELKNMSAVEQLDYVYKYFKMVGVKPGMDLGDLYMAVFMPKYVGADDNTVLGQNGAAGFSGKVYAQNKGLDKNKDGAITVADVKSSVQRFA
jgi:hypothetical protein